MVLEITTKMNLVTGIFQIVLYGELKNEGFRVDPLNFSILF